MQIDKLSSFNKQFFQRIVGLRIKQKRETLGFTRAHIAGLMALTPKALQMIETGQKNLTQEHFEFFVSYFSLDPNELQEMSRITHVQYLMDVYKEIDEDFPA